MFTKLLATIKQQKNGIIFMSKMVLFYAILAGIYEWILIPYTQLDFYLIQTIITHSEILLQFLGYDLIEKSTLFPNLIGIKNSSGVIIGGPCDGLSLFILFSTFIFAFSGKWWMKIVSIVTGISIIHTLNVFRVVALALIVVNAPEQLDFHHSYTFTLFVYGVVFGLWMLRIKVYQWIKK